MMTEKFFEGDRTLTPSRLATRMVTAKGVQWLVAESDEDAKVLRYRLPDEQSQGVIFTTAAPRYRGMTKGEPATSPKNTLRIDDFAKAVVGSGSTESLVSGQLLEIVPLQHPSTLNAGDEMQVQVLHKGKPLQTSVKAIPPSGDTQRLKTDDSGIAMINVSAAGIWVIKAGIKSRSAEDNMSGAYEAGASLLFTL